MSSNDLAYVATLERTLVLRTISLSAGADLPAIAKSVGISPTRARVIVGQLIHIGILQIDPGAGYLRVIDNLVPPLFDSVDVRGDRSDGSAN